MKITITRKNEAMSFGGRVKLYLNDAPTLELANGQTTELQANIEGSETAILSVKGIKPTRLPVQDGHHILLESNPLYPILLSTGLSILTITMVLQYSTVFALPFLIGSFLVEQYKLSKIN